MSDPFTDGEIDRSVIGDRGRYSLPTPHGEAELTYRITGPDRVIADHTFTPPPLEGRGIARRLLDELLADARAEGFRIVPACPYIEVQRRRHPDWADLFTR